MNQTKSKSGIYQITNRFNGRCYIGSAVNLQKRKNEHFNQLKHNKHKNKFLQNDFNKCGCEVFTYKVLCFCSKTDLIATEQEILDKNFDKQKKCYNMVPKAGGNYNFSGSKHHGSKPVYQYSLKGVFVKAFANARIAGECSNTNKTSINLACNNKIKSAGKCLWSYQKKDRLTKLPLRIRPKKTGTSYLLISPSGKKYNITNLVEFCENHYLNYSSIQGVVHGRRNSCFGWMGSKG